MTHRRWGDALKIYTKTGDTGSTSLANGRKVKKTAERIECYGSLDELNSHLGLVKELFKERLPQLDAVILELTWLQEKLFSMSSELACFKGADPHQVTANDTSRIEQHIDWLTAQLPPLKNFVLPGGSTFVCSVHIARTVCRRAERALVRVAESEELRAELFCFANRLSDWLFTLSRYVAQQQNVAETLWSK